jgi:hypothetical protein
MWKTLVVGTTLLAMAGSTLAYAQQPPQAQRPDHARLTADDRAVFTDARIAAFKTALKLTPAQEKTWPAVEQAIRENAKERMARREARRAAGPQTDAIARLRNRADALTNRAAALKRLADAEQPLYQSLDEAQKHRFGVVIRFVAPRHVANDHTHNGRSSERAG